MHIRSRQISHCACEKNSHFSNQTKMKWFKIFMLHCCMFVAGDNLAEKYSDEKTEENYHLLHASEENKVSKLSRAERNKGKCDYYDSCAAKDGITCGNQERYIFYEVSAHEGFNLRRDVYMRFAIMLARAHKRGEFKDWKLVLPPWTRLYHWDNPELRDQSYNLPWSAFFDVDSLKEYAPVIELHEVFSKTNKSNIQMDFEFNLKGYENPFENGVFEDKWDILKRNFKYEVSYFGYKNLTGKYVFDLLFQGKISMLLEVMEQFCWAMKVIFVHGEIPLHDEYGTKEFWQCRKSMKFSKRLKNLADEFVKEKLDCFKQNCNNYLSVHWRRKDFVTLRGDVPSVIESARQINKFLIDKNKKGSAITKIFIATDAKSKEKIELKKELLKYGYEVFFYNPSLDLVQAITEGGVAIIEQIICSRAAYFIGTHESTFTFRIYEERELLKMHPDSTFNRLCPDKGDCEPPGRWRLVE